MQRKALKQLGKVTQWTNEKVFSGEKTQLSSEFTEFERDVEVKRKGIERLHATSMPYFDQMTKVKPTADPYPPQGSGKDKILHTEALGLVMIDYGGDLRDTFGDALSKYGRARCKLAIAQEELGTRLRETYIAGIESSMETVNDYKSFRKKLDSRRLTLDAAITKLNTAKKDHEKLDDEVTVARERFQEIEEETAARMEDIQAGDEQQFEALTYLLEAELAYFSKCKEILEELQESWPRGGVSSSSGRPRAKSNASSRSAAKPNRSFRSAPASSDDEKIQNRSRSQSNASSTGRGKEKRSMLPSFGSFGKKAGLTLGVPKRKSSIGRYGDDERAALNSEDDEEEEEEDVMPPPSPRSAFAAGGRVRSSSTLSTTHFPLSSSDVSAAPALRRTYTSPPGMGARLVRAVFDFSGDNSDELSLRVGMIVEVKSEVSSDWWIGEADGRSGMFPAAYTEEYVPTPQTTLPPPMPRRNVPPWEGGASRAMPPPMSGSGASRAISAAAGSSHASSSGLPPSPPLDYQMTSDSEMSENEDADHRATASLSANSQPAPRARATLAVAGKKPPPPPPSRRSQSSSNVRSYTSSPVLGPVPGAGNRSRASTLTRQIKLDSSPEGSPFAGSEDDEWLEEKTVSGPASAAAANAAGRGRAGSGASGGAGVGAGGGLASGLGAMHLGKQGPGGSGAATSVDACKECGCGDFTQNVFKPKGTCSTCFHLH